MKQFLTSLIAFSLALSPLMASASAIPDFPMAFWGAVTINGNAAPVGTVIRAYYGSTLAGTVTVQESGIYGYTEPTKQKLVIGAGTGVITFTMQASSFNNGAETGGDSAVTYAQFSSASTINDNLAFTITIPAPSGGSSGGGGGGGGGGIAPTNTTTNVVTSTKADATGDGKVDVLDFNALLIQWGKKGASLTADFNGDGVVDILDFNQLLINWSK